MNLGEKVLDFNEKDKAILSLVKSAVGIEPKVKWRFYPNSLCRFLELTFGRIKIVISESRIIYLGRTTDLVGEIAGEIISEYQKQAPNWK